MGKLKTGFRPKSLFTAQGSIVAVPRLKVKGEENSMPEIPAPRSNTAPVNTGAMS